MPVPLNNTKEYQFLNKKFKMASLNKTTKANTKQIAYFLDKKRSLGKKIKYGKTHLWEADIILMEVMERLCL